MMLASDLNQDFAEYDQRVRLGNAKIASILVITLVPFGAILDWFVYPQFLLPFFALRIICSLATAAAWLLLASRLQKQVYPYLIHAWYLFPTLAISCMIAMSEGAVSPYYAGLNLVILAVSAVMQTSLKESLFTLGAIFGMYLGACLLYGRVHDISAVFGNVYFLTLTALIVLAGNYNYNKLRYQEFVLRHQLHESQGQLEASNLQLRALDEAKSRFFANISHELRTPLTLIASPIERLRQNGVIRQNADLFQLTGIMEANSLRLLRLINNLLDLVRLEGSQNAAPKSTVMIDELLGGLVTSIEHVALSKGIQLKCDFDPSETPILVDQDALEKIVLNLLLNAIKFTPAGGTVSLHWQISDQQLQFEVKDTGIGISQEDLIHIFDRFWQANTSSTRKFQGVGIGLALVKELTESMGGKVTAESQPGAGTQFTVSLPVEMSSREALVTPAPGTPAADSPDEWLVSLYRRADLFINPEAQRSLADQVELSRRKRPLVLIGEDQPDMAAFIAAQLKEDFDVLIAADGQYAIDMSRQYKPDLLVLDLMMPEKDGLEVCQELEGEVRARGLPILILTARADDETKLKVLQNGATDFLTKPFSTTELRTRCRNLVALSLLSTRVANQNQELRQHMDQIKDSEVRMVQHAKMISLGRMSAGLIHEINNPLNYVLGAVRLLKRKCEGASIASLDDIFNDIDHGLHRVSELVGNLRTFSHPNPRSFESINLLHCVEQARRLAAPLESNSVTTEIDIPADLAVRGNTTQLSQVFINLIQNAIDACGPESSRNEPGRIRIAAAAGESDVVVKIRDNGQGIPADVIDKIFDPFFTTKDVGSGMGLGLSICHAIIKSHGGRLDVSSEPGEGTVVTVTLPTLAEADNISNPDNAEQYHESLVQL
jgi:signal transduction histidine kinase